MSSNSSLQNVFPDSFQVILNQYLAKPEVKSLAPDGKSCDGKTKGLLRRANVVARSVVPVGKETDQHWEQGEDPSMLDPKIQIYGKTVRGTPQGAPISPLLSNLYEIAAEIGVYNLEEARRKSSLGDPFALSCNAVCNF